MNNDLKIAHMEGTIALLEEDNRRLQSQLDWFAKSQDAWRSRYLDDHPEIDNWDTIEELEP